MSESNRVINTSRQPSERHFMGVLTEGSESYITGMEAAGQQQLVQSSILPADATGRTYGSDGWAELAELGFVKGDPVPNDALFVTVQLPEGWTKKASDHNMWSYVYDQRGVKRVAVFYKAAFYDRRAHMRVMDVGGELASDIIYSDGPVALPPQWGQLTADEIAAFHRGVASYLADFKRSPDIYGDRLHRARRIVALLPFAESESAR